MKSAAACECVNETGGTALSSTEIRTVMDGDFGERHLRA